MLAQNLRTRGPFLGREIVQRRYLWEYQTFRRGWPFPYFERIERSVTFYLPNAVRPGTEFLPPTFESATFDRRNPRTWAALGNVLLAVVVTASTVVVCASWQRRRQGKLQFGLRLMMIVTAFVAVVVAMIDRRVLSWWSLLSLPIAAGIVSLPAVVGLGLERLVLRSDRHSRELRSRYKRSTGDQGLDRTIE